MTALRNALHENTFVRNINSIDMEIQKYEMNRLLAHLRVDCDDEKAAIINWKMSNVQDKIDHANQHMSNLVRERNGTISEIVRKIVNDEKDAERLPEIKINNIGEWINDYFKKVTVPLMNAVCGTIAAYTVEEAKRSINTIVAGVEHAMDDFRAFTNRVSDIAASDAMCHVMKSLQDRYETAKSNPEKNVNGFIWDSYDNAVKIIDTVDSNTCDIIMIELQEAIDGKIIGYTPKLNNTAWNELELEQLIRLKTLFEYYYSHSFEFSVENEYLTEYRKKMQQEKKKTDADKVSEQTPREKEIVEMYGEVLDRFDDPEMIMNACHKRIGTEIMFGKFDLEKHTAEIKQMREKREKEIAEMRRKQEEAERNATQEKAEEKQETADKQDQ